MKNHSPEDLLLGELHDHLATHGPTSPTKMAKAFDMEAVDLIRIVEGSDWFNVDLEKNIIQIALEP